MASIETEQGVTIEYETHGKEGDPVALLVMGLSAQLVFWPPALIDAIVEAGFRVVTFDNRDVGLSQKFHGKRPPNPIAQIALARFGLKLRAPYTLVDMADDTEGLLDALGIDQAHLIGASMGGMIGQVFAATRPERTASLTSLISSTNNPALPRADRKVAGPVLLNRRRSNTRDEMIDNALGLWSLIGTDDPDADPADLRGRIEKAFDRSYYPAGVRRQVAAIIATGDLRPFSRKITAPTLVVHGSDDPLAPVEGGIDTANTIPGAKLEIIEGMGHDLPAKFITRINQLIVDHIQSAEKTRSREAAI